MFPPNPNGYRAFGGRTPATSDQANGLSQAHRDGGYMVTFAHTSIPGVPFPSIDDSFFTDLFPKMFDTSDGFPGFIGSNHVGPNTMGPMKEDWTKACPLEWTEEERDEKCISQQEAIYGTKLLERLEAIKEAVDPNYMFDCNKCIGNNRVKSVPAPVADDVDVEQSPPPPAADDVPALAPVPVEVEVEIEAPEMDDSSGAVVVASFYLVAAAVSFAVVLV